MNWIDVVAQGTETSLPSAPAAMVSAVAASITAVTAIVAAIVAFQQIRLARRLRLEQIQPYIAVFMQVVPGVPHFVDLVVKNFGQTAARNISVEISPSPLRSSNDRAGQPEQVLYPRRLPTLVPDQEWRTLWDFAPARSEQNLEGRHVAVVTCEGVAGTSLEFIFDLDWEFFTGTRWVQTYGVHDAAKALREMEKHMRGWREGPNRGLKVYVRDGDRRDEESRRRWAERTLEQERQSQQGPGDDPEA